MCCVIAFATLTKIVVACIFLMTIIFNGLENNHVHVHLQMYICFINIAQNYVDTNLYNYGKC